MAKFAVVRNNKVINLIEASKAADYPTSDTLVQSNTAGVGDTYNGGSSFTPAPFIAIPNWSGWVTDISANAAYNTFFNSFLGGVLATATNLRSLHKYDNYLDILSTRGDDPKMYATFIARWNAIVLIPLINLPGPAVIAAWNTISTNNSMPFSFNASTAQMVLN